MRANKVTGDILLYGNAAYFTQQNIKEIAGDRHIAVAGGQIAPSHERGVRRYRRDSRDQAFDRLFEVYDFETVLFVSGYLTFDSAPEDEIEELRRLLHLARRHKVRRGIILMPHDLCYKRAESRRMELEFEESLCRYYAGDDFQIQIIRCPFLCSGSVRTDYFYRMFDALSNGGGWTFPRPAAEKTDFITMRDLSVFLSRLLDKAPVYRCRVTDLRGYTRYTFSDAARLLSERFPAAQISCARDMEPDTLSFAEDTAREELGWFAAEDVFAHLEEMIRAYEISRPDASSGRKRFSERVEKHRGIVTALEVAAGAVVMELLNHLLNNSVQFRLIDVRLLYVVLISSVYGMRVGTVAALIACLSLAAAYQSRGITALMLFYEPDNWLAFVLMLTAAAVCGLARDRHREERETLQGQIDELKQDTAYTNQLYDEAISYKNEYRQNLLTSRDSFGRIFGVVQKLSVTEPTKLYGEAVDVLEDVLDNRTVAIYSISDDTARFARLEVASAGISGKLPKSIRLEAYDDIVQTVLAEQIWVNRDLKANLPAYAAGIRRDDKLRVIILICQASFEQMNAYYENLLEVLCGMIGSFLLEAWSYQEASGHKREGVLVSDEVFQRELELRRELADHSLASYGLVRIARDDRDPKALSLLLEGRIRTTDLVAENPADGDYYLLLPQADGKTAQIVVDRLSAAGLRCTLVAMPGGAS